MIGVRAVEKAFFPKAGLPNYVLRGIRYGQVPVIILNVAPPLFNLIGI